MFKCFAIAPYEGFKEMLLELRESYPFRIDVQLGNIRRTEDLLNHVEQNGYDVVISRGGTAEFFKKHSQIPVIEIEITSYDILRTLTILKGYKGKMGMIGSANVLQNVQLMTELLEIEVLQQPIETVEDIEQAISEAIHQGIEVIIGDALAVSLAEAKGIQTIMIASGKEAIVGALKKVVDMYYFYEQKEKETDRFLSLLNKLNQGIFIIDSNNRITLVNKKTEELLGLPKESILELNWKDLLQKWNLNDITGLTRRKPHFLEWNHKWHILQKCPSSKDELIFTLQEAEQIQDLERMLRRKLYGAVMKPEEKLKLNQLMKKLKIAEEVLDNLEAWDRACKPILISGEAGTNKGVFAQALYQNSKYNQGPFIAFDAHLVPPEEAENQLFGSENQHAGGLIEHAHEGTLYIKEIGKLPLAAQSKLSEILLQQVYIPPYGDEKKPSRFKLIASSSIDLLTEMNANRFHAELYYLLKPQYISIPALRERIEDLDDIARWFLAEVNTTMNKQVVAFKPDILKKLKTYHWPGNLTELKHVLGQLIERTNSMFVTMDIAKPVLDQLFSTNSKKLFVPYLTENMTLEEIETNIILMVLEQEHYNQSKTAKRLGINRATLYRKIKEHLQTHVN